MDKGYKIYAVDFDKTLSMAPWPEVGDANIGLINYLRERQAAGDKVILNTCRSGEILEKALAFCETYGLVFDAVNENLPEIIEKYGSDSRKISADYYIDDKAVNPAALLSDEKIEITTSDLPITVASKLIQATKKVKNPLAIVRNKLAGGDGTEDFFSWEDIKEIAEYLLTFLSNNKVNG